jgi:hypothetical protein
MEEINIPKEAMLDKMYNSIKKETEEKLRELGIEIEIVDIVWTKEGLTLKLSSLT